VAVGWRQIQPASKVARLANADRAGLDADAATLQALDSTAKTLEKHKANLQDLREEPTRLLKHVRRQLTRRLNVSASTPFRQDDLLELPNLVGLAKQRKDAYQQELRDIEVERQEFLKARQAWLEKRAPLKSNMDLLTNEIQQIEALIVGDMQRVTELQNEAASLQQQLPTRCDAGNRCVRIAAT
jgi:chromosome segregation ATPase